MSQLVLMQLLVTQTETPLKPLQIKKAVPPFGSQFTPCYLFLPASLNKNGCSEP